MKSRHELEIVKNFVDSTYSHFGNKLIVDTSKKYDPEHTKLGFCFKHIDPVTGGVTYKIDCSRIGIERTDFRIMMHEYAHIYLGHLDGIHEELDVQICNAFRDHRPELIEIIVRNCGIDEKTADRFIERVIDDPELNHEIHNIAMDMECNSSVLSKDDIEEMETDISSVLPRYAEEALEKAIKDAKSEDYKKELEDRLHQMEKEAKIKLMIPERYYLEKDADGNVTKPFPNDLSYEDYLLLIILHIDQFVKMLVSIEMGGNGETKDITKEDIQNALAGMFKQMRQRSQQQSEAYRQGYMQALRDARNGKVDPSKMNQQKQDPTAGKSEEYKEGFKQGVEDTMKKNFGTDEFKQGYQDGYNDQMNQQNQQQGQNSQQQSGSQGQQNQQQGQGQDQSQSGKQGNQSQGSQQQSGSQGSQQGGQQNQSGMQNAGNQGTSPQQGSQSSSQQGGSQDQSQGTQQKSQDYQDGYDAGQRDAQMSQQNQGQQNQQNGNGGQQQNQQQQQGGQQGNMPPMPGSGQMGNQSQPGQGSNPGGQGGQQGQTPNGSQGQGQGDPQGQSNGNGSPSSQAGNQNGQGQGDGTYQDGYNDGKNMAQNAIDQAQQQGQGGQGQQGNQQGQNGNQQGQQGQGNGQGQEQGQGQGQGGGQGNGQSQEMQDFNNGYQQALQDLANSQNGQGQGQGGQGQGLSDLLKSMGVSSGGGMSQPGFGGNGDGGTQEHNKKDPGQKKGQGREQKDSLNPYEGIPGNQDSGKDHQTDSRDDADKKREAGQIQAGGGVGMGRGGGPDTTREVDKFADDVDMALSEVLNDIHNKVVKSEVHRDMMKLYNRGINRSVIAPSLSRKVTISTKPKLVFLIDISGSMDTRLIDRILNTIAKSLKKLNRDLRYDIITWSTRLGEHIKDIDPKKSIPRISCGGGTEMAGGMRYFKEHYGPEAILVLISDFCDSLDQWHEVERTMRKYSMWGFNYGDNRYSYKTGNWDWTYFKQRDFSDYGYDD